MNGSLRIANVTVRKTKPGRLVILVCAWLSTASPARELYALDPSRTHPTFDVTSLGFMHTHGTFGDAGGAFILDRTSHRGTIEVVIDTRSLATGSARRDAFLKGKEFFDVDAWPNATVLAENFNLDGDFPRQVKGTLIMVGVSQPISLTITSLNCEGETRKLSTCRGHVDTTIQRSRWGMTRYAHIVSNDVTISVDVEATLTGEASAD
jgi:polyisoprenoid-binding protein YceI